MENDFLRRCLQYAEEQRRLQALTIRVLLACDLSGRISM